MVLFILVYLVAAAAAAATTATADQLQPPGRPPGLAGAKIEMRPDDTIQYLQFDDVQYNMMDFTICTWIKLTNFSHAQTIFRLTGSKKETVMLWRVHARPKETTRVTIKNRLVASESTRLAGGRWNHVCFQWKGSTGGVWAMFVNAKIHSVGQAPAAAGNDTTWSAASWTLRGKGAGIVGDDGAPCRNGWQAYGLYATGTTAAAPKNATGPPSAAGPGRRAKNANKRQAVFDTATPDPDGPAAPPKPFQWLTKSFAFVKRVFTFVIVPFFKFVRNTFFQTRSLDDTVVDVSETQLTVSEVEFEPHPMPATGTANATGAGSTTESAAIANATGTANATKTEDNAAAAAATVEPSNAIDVFPDGGVQRRSSASAKREASGGDERCVGSRADDGRVTAADLLAAGATPLRDDALSPSARRYLKTISDGLSVAGVDAAFVRRAFACCAGPTEGRDAGARALLVDWDRSRARAHNVTASPHACGRP